MSKLLRLTNYVWKKNDLLLKMSLGIYIKMYDLKNNELRTYCKALAIILDYLYFLLFIFLKQHLFNVFDTLFYTLLAFFLGKYHFTSKKNELPVRSLLFAICT